MSVIPFNKISLVDCPDALAYGYHVLESEVMEWVVPSDRWLAVVAEHDGILNWNAHVIPYSAPSLLVFPPRSRCRLERSGRDHFVHHHYWFRPTSSDIHPVALRVVTDIHDKFHVWKKDVDAGFVRFPYTTSQLRSLLWTMLWSVAEGMSPIVRPIHVEKAQQLIEARMSEKLSVEAISRELEISQSQLNRLFNQEHGISVRSYISLRRMNLACKLLTTTTHPIKSIAVMVGIPDLQHFNKVIREAFGLSPTDLRANRRDWAPHTDDVGIREHSLPRSSD